MHSDTLVKQNPVNSEKYAVMFSMLIKEFENRFQECWGKKKNCIFATQYSADINTLPVNFQIECIELQPDKIRQKSDEQLENSLRMAATSIK